MAFRNSTKVEWLRFLATLGAAIGLWSFSNYVASVRAQHPGEPICGNPGIGALGAGFFLGGCIGCFAGLLVAVKCITYEGQRSRVAIIIFSVIGGANVGFMGMLLALASPYLSVTTQDVWFYTPASAFLAGSLAAHLTKKGGFFLIQSN
jgi:hypothetical protein